VKWHCPKLKQDIRPDECWEIRVKLSTCNNKECPHYETDTMLEAMRKRATRAESQKSIVASLSAGAVIFTLKQEVSR